MTDRTATIADLQALLRDFARERDWEQFHHPKDLGLALAVEVGELLDHFRFLTNEQIGAKLADHAGRRALAHELADVAGLALRLADVMGIDLAAAVAEKTVLAAAKYPAELVRGLPHKYTHYQSAAGAPPAD